MRNAKSMDTQEIGTIDRCNEQMGYLTDRYLNGTVGVITGLNRAPRSSEVVSAARSRLPQPLAPSHTELARHVKSDAATPTSTVTLS
jgi:hypothetical protein